MVDQTWRSSQRWKDTAAVVKRLHGYTCQCCGAREGWLVQLDVHHKNDAATHTDLIFVIENLIPLCVKCHTGEDGYHAWMGGTNAPSTAASLDRFLAERKQGRAETVLAVVVLVLGLAGAALAFG